ncbi:hypothetical protein DVK85_05850 [Flavobacterium arcticum]|uniref:DUF4369 domain-containing protein n=1 Tax=Flavobacterium arcticum TaxID=1784713 RepID=A0A345HB23_9FLAO|nr:hypothetical protein [Flavobacterium arcticum]AXG73783.1 hypothetical protein DVK85_05850 [Flavobacterium arcticum]KAF2511735.1 hypothetical protein E0W72_05360 [Flavobacterium arcticum]
MKLSLTALVILFSTHINAQFYNGSITLNDGKKLTGLIEFNYDNGINYKKSENADFSAISSDKIKSVQANINDTNESFVFLDAPFSLTRIDEPQNIKKRLFRIMSQGKVTLLEYTPSTALVLLYSTEITVLYLQKTDAEMPKMYAYIQRGAVIGARYKRRGFKEFATEYFSDCPTLVEKINNKDFKAKHAIEVIDYYNNSCN